MVYERANDLSRDTPPSIFDNNNTRKSTEFEVEELYHRYHDSLQVIALIPTNNVPVYIMSSAEDDDIDMMDDPGTSPRHRSAMDMDDAILRDEEMNAATNGISDSRLTSAASSANTIPGQASADLLTEREETQLPQRKRFRTGTKSPEPVAGEGQIEGGSGERCV